MAEIKVSLPDGSVREFPQDASAKDVAGSIGKGLQKAGIAARYNGELVDYTRPLAVDGNIEIITKDDDEALEILRHSAAHIMAQAIKRLHPDVKFGVGPTIENGFYYDTDMDVQLTEEELPAVEKEMMEIVKANYPFERREVSREEALEIFADDPYKVELITELPEDDIITVYTQGEFTDLCRGIHIESTGKLQVFKLMNLAGAYWRGNSDNKMMQRVYGTAFFNKKDLKEYVKMREEAKERDHRKLGKELDLFMVDQQAGQGLPFWLPKGATIRRTIER